MSRGPLKHIKSVKRVTAEDLRAELRDFEQRFGMSSEEFLSRWRSGQHPELDSPEYFDWVGACYMAVREGVLEVPTDVFSA
jgi:hypothetical protein